MSTTAVEIPGYVAGTYTIGPGHSDVAFTVRHMPGAPEAGVRAQRCRCKTCGPDACLLAVVGVANGAESS